MNQKYDGPPSSIIMGNLGDITANGGFSEKLFDFLHEGRGDVVRFWIASSMQLSVSDASKVQALYKQGVSRPKETFLFLNYLGKENLLFQHGPMVKQLRLRYGKMVSTRLALESVHQVSIDHFARHITKWDSKPVNLFAELGPLIYDIMGQVLFGDVWTETDHRVKIREHHTYLIANSLRWAFYPVNPWWNSEYRRYVSSTKTLRNLCSEMIQEHEDRLNKNPEKYKGDSSALTMLIREVDENNERFFSHELAISTLIGFLNGAYDTTHATLYWLFFHLAKYQDVQEKLFEEIVDNVGLKLTPTLEELRELPYMLAVMQESLRFRTTVPMNQRVNLEEDMDLDGLHVPAGVTVCIPLFILMRDEKVFGPETDHFIPERFLGDTKQAKLARANFMAFGGHSRMCVGFTFALAEMRAVVCTVLQRYKIKLEDPQDPGEMFVEAGVNQPVKPAKFIFEKHPKQDMSV